MIEKSEILLINLWTLSFGAFSCWNQIEKFPLLEVEMGEANEQQKAFE